MLRRQLLVRSAANGYDRPLWLRVSWILRGQPPTFLSMLVSIQCPDHRVPVRQRRGMVQLPAAVAL
jgi:hypothetical protein